MIRIKRFDNYKCTDEEINAFLEANNAEYVDMRCSNDSVFLIYRDRENTLENKKED